MSRPLFSPKKLAITIAIIVTLWIISGIISPPAHVDEAENKPVAAQLPTVEVSPYNAINHLTTLKIYGVTQSSRRVDMKAEVSGKVVEIFAKEGDMVKKDAVILQIETRDLDATLAQAKSLVKQRQIEYDAALKLGEKGFSAETKSAESAANLEFAKAQLIRAQVDIDNTLLKAPFDGWLEKVNVEVGDLVGPGILVGQGTFNDGSNIITLIDRDPTLIIGQVSEHKVGMLHAGQPSSITLVNDRTIHGTLSYVSGVADPVTRTFRVEIEIPNADGSIVSGSTAEIKIPIKEELAYHIPSSLLVLNSSGEIGIKTLDAAPGEQGNVVFHPIQIIDSDPQGLWVGGLPDRLNIITRGQEFVKEGGQAKAAAQAEAP